jgi:hypothetical protein
MDFQYLARPSEPLAGSGSLFVGSFGHFSQAALFIGQPALSRHTIGYQFCITTATVANFDNRLGRQRERFS